MGSFSTRFGLLFYSDTLSAERGMGLISKQLGNIQTQIAAISELSDKAFSFLASKLAGFGAHLIGTASKMEKTKEQFMFAFKKIGVDAEDAFNKAQEAGLRSVQTTDQVLQGALDMARIGKVNIFDPRATEQVKKALPDVTDLSDVLGDMASINPYGFQGVARALSEMLSGQWQGARMRLDMGSKQLEEYKQALAGVQNQQEGLIKIAPLLARDFGGAAAAMKDTWSFIAAQLDDVSDKLFGSLGKPMLDRLKPALKELVNFFVGDNGILLNKNTKMLEGLRNVFAQIGDVLAFVAKEAVNIFKNISSFIMQHPGIVKFAVKVAALTAAFAGLVSVLLAIKASIFVVAAAFGGLTLPFMLLGGVLAAVSFNLLKFWLRAKDLGDVWDRLKTVFGGVAEAIATLNGGVVTLTDKTFKDLEKKGLLNLTLGVVRFAVKAQKLFKDISDAVQSVFNKIVEVVTWIIEHRSIFEMLALGYGIQRATERIKGFASGLKGVKGSTLGDPGGPTTRVWVVNMPGGGLLGGGGGAGPSIPGGLGGFLGKAGSLGNLVISNLGNLVMAAEAGYAFGTFLDEKLKISDKVSQFMFDVMNPDAETATDMVKKLRLRDERAQQTFDLTKPPTIIPQATPSLGIKDIVGLDKTTGATSPATGGSTNLTVPIYIDGIKTAEKQVSIDAVRSGKGSVVK